MTESHPNSETAWKAANTIIDKSLADTSSIDDIDLACDAIVKYTPAFETAKKRIEIAEQKIAESLGGNTRLQSIQAQIATLLEVESFTLALPTDISEALTSIQSGNNPTPQPDEDPMSWMELHQNLEKADEIARNTDDVDIIGDTSVSFRTSFNQSLNRIAGMLKITAEVFGPAAALQSLQDDIAQTFNSDALVQELSPELQSAFNKVTLFQFTTD